MAGGGDVWEGGLRRRVRVGGSGDRRGEVGRTEGLQALLGGDDVVEGEEDVHETLGLRVGFGAVAEDGDGVFDARVRRGVVVEGGEFVGEDDEGGGEDEVYDEWVALLEVAAFEGVLNKADCVG